MEKREALELVGKIEDFWHVRGYPHIKARAERMTVVPVAKRPSDHAPETYEHYEVRSNLTGHEQCELIPIKHDFKYKVMTLAGRIRRR